MSKELLLDNIIARRELILVAADGVDRPAHVLFARPRKVPRLGGDYMCEWQAPELSAGRIYAAYGVDEVQALELALQMAGITLQTCREAREGRLFWLERGHSDLGFPRLQRSSNDGGANPGGEGAT
jgi:hypothetical protein